MDMTPTMAWLVAHDQNPWCLWPEFSFEEHEVLDCVLVRLVYCPRCVQNVKEACEVTRDSINTNPVFAAVGDVHGQMHAMVRLIEIAAKKAKVKIDFVLQVGDFEPHRKMSDVATMAAPMKYRQLGDFPDFRKRRATFPWPIWFIGGNHEPYGFLDSIRSGEAVAPRCFWWGRTGRRQIEGLDIAGLSGICVEEFLNIPRPPIADIEQTKKKLYIHFTEDEVAELLSDQPVDILLVHEWPRGAYTGDEQRRRTLADGQTGNEWARLLVDTLRPQLVLGGHMHWSHRSWIGKSRFVGLADVASGLESVALFRVTDEGIEEIDFR